MLEQNLKIIIYPPKIILMIKNIIFIGLNTTICVFIWTIIYCNFKSDIRKKI